MPGRLTCPQGLWIVLSIMKKNTKTKKNEKRCDCPECRAYFGQTITQEDVKNEEMAFLRTVGVKVKKAKTFEDALKLALR